MLSCYDFDNCADIGGNGSQFSLPVLHMRQALAGVDVKFEKAILERVVRLAASAIDRKLGLHARLFQVTGERDHDLIGGSFGLAVEVLNCYDAGVPLRSPDSESLLLLFQIILDVAHP